MVSAQARRRIVCAKCGNPGTDFECRRCGDRCCLECCCGRHLDCCFWCCYRAPFPMPPHHALGVAAGADPERPAGCREGTPDTRGVRDSLGALCPNCSDPTCLGCQGQAVGDGEAMPAATPEGIT